MLLSVSNLGKAFGSDSVLDGLNLKVAAREKVALVGRNGCGKTTLLRILAGLDQPDVGSVHLARGAKIGYLSQDSPVGAGTVLEEAQKSRTRIVELARRLKELEAKLRHAPSDADLEEYALAHEHFLEAEGHSAERDVETVLQRMGFGPEDHAKQTSVLSGGEKTRLALARLLLEEPDLLILDEPTNHLDLQATEWLERWIGGYLGAVLLVSHDRVFLQNTAERVVQVLDGKAKSYEGGFERFLTLREEEEAWQLELAKRTRKQMDKLDEYVRRFMGSERTAQARGRLKMLRRLEKDAVGPPAGARRMSAAVKAARRSGDLVLQANGLGMTFDSAGPGSPRRTLFSGLDWTIRWRERWGIIGDNGAGKSTLVKVILGMAPPTEGATKIGASVEAGIFTQDLEDISGDQSPLEFMIEECGLLPAEARDILARYLIVGDDVFRPIRTLSGGERNKLALARLTTLNPNLLVLDEPTNHLDFDSREALAKVLGEYDGTLVLVSHDRWLLGQVTTRTLDLRSGKAVIYPGSYPEYSAATKVASTGAAPSRSKKDPVSSGLSQREVSKEIVRLTKLVEQIEHAVAAKELEVLAVEASLSSLPSDADVLDLTRRHTKLKEELAALIASWEEQSLALEDVKGARG